MSTTTPTASSTVLPTCGSTGVILDLPLNNVAIDMSGCNHGVTLTNTTLELDRFGNQGGAVRFGANSYIEITNSALLDMETNSYTLAAWVKFDTTEGAQRIFSKGSSYCMQHPGYMLRTNGANILQEFTCSQGGSGSCDVGKAGQTSLDTGVWHYVVNTIERGGQGKIYIDGNLDTGSVVSNVPNCSVSNRRSMFIGYNPDLPTQEQFYGVMDDIKVVRGVVWSDNDVLQSYNIGSSYTASATHTSSASVSTTPTYSSTVSSSYSPTSSMTSSTSYTASSSVSLTPSMTSSASYTASPSVSSTPSMTSSTSYTAPPSASASASASASHIACNATSSNVNILIGSSYNDILEGNGKGNFIDGLNGNDIIMQPNVGNNTSVGGSGTDTMVYKYASQSIVVDVQNGEVRSEGAIPDKMFSIEKFVGTPFNDIFLANSTCVSFDGGDGTNTLSFESSPIGVVVSLIDSTINENH